MYGSRTPRVQVCHSRYLAREGVGGSAREAVCTSTAAGGGLSAAARRSSLLGGHGKAAQIMPNEQPPPKVRAAAKKIDLIVPLQDFPHFGHLRRGQPDLDTKTKLR